MKAPAHLFLSFLFLACCLLLGWRLGLALQAHAFVPAIPLALGWYASFSALLALSRGAASPSAWRRRLG